MSHEHNHEHNHERDREHDEANERDRLHGLRLHRYGDVALVLRSIPTGGANTGPHLLRRRMSLMAHYVTSPPSFAALRKDYSITSSAMESTPDGTSMPSARPVSRSSAFFFSARQFHDRARASTLVTSLDQRAKFAGAESQHF